MEKTANEVYAALMRRFDSHAGIGPGAVAEALREVERMHTMGEIEDWQLQNAREAFARPAGGRAGDAAHWVMDKAKDSLQAAAGQVRKRAGPAVATYTMNDPVRAILIAAATGAILMSLVSVMARSGVRSVRRKIDR